MGINNYQLTSNNGKRKIVLALFIVICSLFIDNLSFAQEGEYYIDDNSRFVQRLAWEGDEYSQYYEVVIERDEGGVYRKILRETTGELFIEVSLPPGKYRLRVTPYDYRDVPGVAEWKDFEVLAALMPEAADFSLGADGKGKNALHVLTVYGKNLVPGTEIFLRNAEGDIVYPLETTIFEDGSRARLLFAPEQLVTGNYEIIIRNPGGLETGMGGLVVTKQKKIFIYAGAAYMPLFPLYDGDRQLFNAKPSFAGAGLRFGITPYERNTFANVGLEAAASWYSSPVIINGNESGVQAVTIGLNLVAQKRSPKDIAVMSFRLGAGYTLLSQEPDLLSTVERLHINFGLSCLWMVTERLYLEAGADYKHYFTEYFSGALQPWIGVGVRF